MFFIKEGFIDDRSIYLISKGEVELVVDAQRRDESNTRLTILGVRKIYCNKFTYWLVISLNFEPYR